MMQLDQYISDLLLPVYSLELRNSPNKFYILCLDVLPLSSDSCKLGTSDLTKNL